MYILHVVGGKDYLLPRGRRPAWLMRDKSETELETEVGEKQRNEGPSPSLHPAKPTPFPLPFAHTYLHRSPGVFGWEGRGCCSCGVGCSGLQSAAKGDAMVDNDPSLPGQGRGVDSG